MTKPGKSLLIKELENHLKSEDYSYSHRSNSSFVVDIMATVRKVNVSGSTFSDFLSGFMSYTNTYRQFGRCNYMFDMYSDEPSVKDSERKRRTGTIPIEYSVIEQSTPLPKDMKTFWPSNNNKLLIEKFIYSHLRSNIPHTDQYPTVLGQVTKDEEDWQCVKIHRGDQNTQAHLQSKFEEADFRILLHVLDSLKDGYKVCVVISNDTEVIVALLHHMPVFLQYNLEELWVRAGIGDSTRYVPLHTLFERIGHHLCKVLPAVHSLTGCDITSKVGTKKAALKAEPDKFLQQFGTVPTLSPSNIRKAELYLVKVLKSSSDYKTFSDLRSEVFHHTKGSSHHNLPPTSQGSCLTSSVAFTMRT